MDASKRLNEAYSFLLYRKAVSSQVDFAKKVGFGEGSMSKALKGDTRYCTQSLLKKVANAFPSLLNKEYLLNGEGKLVADEVVPDDIIIGVNEHPHSFKYKRPSQQEAENMLHDQFDSEISVMRRQIQEQQETIRSLIDSNRQLVSLLSQYQK